MSDYDIDREELTDAIRLMSDPVKKNATIITPDELGRDFFYHIRFEKAKELVPNVSRRSAPTEDNTLPRVHVSPSLNDAWNGYSGGGWLLANKIAQDKKSSHISNGYRGGFYIHRVPFRACLKPNNKLVYDASFTKEHWLVTYNEMTRVYPCTCVGKLIGESVTYQPRVKKPPIETTTVVVEVISPDGLYLKDKLLLKKGYFRYKTSTQNGITDLMEISKSEFLSVKTVSAAMLSFDDKEVPRFLF